MAITQLDHSILATKLLPLNRGYYTDTEFMVSFKKTEIVIEYYEVIPNSLLTWRELTFILLVLIATKPEK